MSALASMTCDEYDGSQQKEVHCNTRKSSIVIAVNLMERLLL